MFHRDTAEIFVPDGLPIDEALRRTTHLCIGAHQDDIEFMAPTPIVECFQQPDKWFAGVTVTDGRGSPRAGLYASYDDEQMREVRFKEQRKAAVVGEYAAQILLDHPSKKVKDAARTEVTADLVAVLDAMRPEVVYTHNLADKHDTHVGTALRTLAAIRQLPAKRRPKRLYGMEVWRDLDWMLDPDKVRFDTSAHENLQAALMGLYDSQIAGGKRYDLGTVGRHRANASFFESHEVDASSGAATAMDMTALIDNPTLEPASFVQTLIRRFADDVSERVAKLG